MCGQIVPECQAGSQTHNKHTICQVAAIFIFIVWQIYDYKYLTFTISGVDRNDNSLDENQ